MAGWRGGGGCGGGKAGRAEEIGDCRPIWVRLADGRQGGREATGRQYARADREVEDGEALQNEQPEALHPRLLPHLRRTSEYSEYSTVLAYRGSACSMAPLGHRGTPLGLHKHSAAGCAEGSAVTAAVGAHRVVLVGHEAVAAVVDRE